MYVSEAITQTALCIVEKLKMYTTQKPVIDHLQKNIAVTGNTEGCSRQPENSR